MTSDVDGAVEKAAAALRAASSIGALGHVAPDPDALGAAVSAFLAEKEDPDRDLLLRAFSAQSAVEWPRLEALLANAEA